MSRAKDSVNQQVEENNGNMIATNNGVVYYGMNYTDVRSLCLDLINEVINKAKQVALIETKKRENELVTKILEKCANANLKPNDIMRAFEEPALQFDFIEAEKAYIKYGTDELKDILSSIVVRRIEEKNHSLLQIALGEAIKTVPLLLKEQMNTLALKFVISHTINLTLNSLQSLREYLYNTIIPIFRSGMSKKESEFQHLTYSRCATITAFNTQLVSSLSSTYSGLFFKGFSEENIPIIENQKLNTLYPNLFTSCLNDNSKLQINAINVEDLDKAMKVCNVKDIHKKQIENLYKIYKMNEQEIKNKLIELCPEIEEVIKYWNDTSISRLNLSSVGIIIGALTTAQITGEAYELEIWV